MMTKKKVLLNSLAAVSVMFLMGYLESLDGCYQYFFSLCDHFGNAARVLMISVILLALSLSTYPLSEKVFSFWVNFAKWWVPLTVILSILAGFGEQPSNMPAMITPGTVSFAMSAIFLTTSIILIAYKHFTLKSGAAK